MANALGIDLANVLSSAETIRRQRAARMAEENALKDQETMRQSRRRALQGDPQGYADMMVLDPASAAQFKTAIAAMGPDQITAERQSLEMMGQLAASVLQSPDPAAAYAEMRAAMPPEIAGTMPETFNPTWLRFSIARLAKADDLFKSVLDTEADTRKQTNALALETARTQGDLEVEREKARLKPADPRVDTAASNAIRQAVEVLFPFPRDSFGVIMPPSPEMVLQQAALAARAEEIMAATPGMTVARAVQQAYSERGPAPAPTAPATSATPASPDDPLGIR